MTFLLLNLMKMLPLHQQTTTFVALVGTETTLQTIVTQALEIPLLGQSWWKEYRNGIETI